MPHRSCLGVAPSRAGPLGETPGALQLDLSEQLRALEEEKQNLLLLVCELLRKNEFLRTELRLCTMHTLER